MHRISTLLLVFLGVISSGLKAQETFPVNGTTDPRHTTFAFTGVKIVVDENITLDSATLLVRDGRVLNSGKGISVPSDAVVFDLKGKCIYPSLVESFSDYGMPEVKRPSGGDGFPQFLSNTKGAYNWNQAVRAEFDAYRNFTAEPKKAEELRKLGFGTVLSVYRDGIVRGTAAATLLGEGKENDLILRDRAAAVYSFDKGSSTQDYPSSLMGSIALLRQTYYDAQWYMNGGYKKEFNITLDAFNKLQKLPQIFDAGDKQNELRANRIGEEFGVRYILKGAGDEYERINEIKAAGNSLIVPVAFPDAYDTGDPYDALNITYHMMKSWELAPGNPSALEKAGINFALTASDLKNKAEFWKNIRKAIDNGLTEKQALKSLTVIPAAMMGLSDQIGALRTGMLANFIITSKSLFDKDNVIYENWVKGKRYQISDANLSDIRGNYTLTIGNLPPMRMKTGGELLNPEVSVFEDTTTAKANFSRTGNLITVQFEFKKREPKGNYRLSGWVEETNPLKWNGNAQIPSGEWVKFSARFDSAFISTPKKDTAKKDNSAGGYVTYPNMAYGWENLPEAQTTVFTNATVWTNEAEGILQNTDVLISDGKIKAIGKNLARPAGCTVVDGTGMHLTSGIIDEHSHIAVTDAVNEGTQSSSAEVRIGDVIDGEDIQIYRQLSGGVTCAHILHGSANAIGGQTQLIKLRWGQSPENLKFQGWPGFIKFALGENVKQSNWGDRQVIRFPQTRMGVEQVYMDYFTRAREYDQQMRKFTSADTKNKVALIPPRKDLELDALTEILNSKRFITCHSYVQSEINMLMHVADTFGFKINTFTHILEGYKVADKMKKHGVRGASSFSDWWAYKYEVYEAIPYNGAIMNKVGLTVSYNSDDPEMARRLNQEAAKAVKYGGISEEEAWKFVTLNPAKILRVEDKVGSIKTGKDADLVLWNENPLSIYAKPLRTYVDGICYFDTARDQQLRDEMQKDKARLVQKMNDAKSRGENVQKGGMRPTIIKHCDEDEHIFMK
ncbi:MAG TPA: amidohydrolase family protein [Bacteroidia bacterium]|nr:amidohydrolase family protein [Bacteroidia bacterium]